MSTPKLNLVVAACNNNGIGINGKLPWNLRKDMDFFKAITMKTSSPDKQNAVIMGRRTWQSIPEKFRPLRNRINIILSREMKDVPEGVFLARSLPEAISLITGTELVDRVEDVHVIGGSSVYKESMTGPYPCRLYLTRVLADFDCDTFLPEIDSSAFSKIPNPENVSTDLQGENGIKFRFEVYEKV
ncbi:DYR-like protein [Mya arenaria]|uniref:dihydrofolate reductase n=1 Tax=Mya arenaria TaxID=6604 RepID=A0ABY7D8M5_MYAAR|nr:dihydrofolate reductase-like [Mya arenaria]WAQ94021.1 DYR-like protein [Mya arenaria]